MNAAGLQYEIDRTVFFEEVLPDLLVNDLVSAVSEGPDEEHLMRMMDDLLMEEGNVLLEDAEEILDLMCEEMRRFPGLGHDALQGYTVVDNLTGALVFDLGGQLESHSSL